MRALANDSLLLDFDRHTLELGALRAVSDRLWAIPGLLRHSDQGELAIVVEAESEATLRATHDLDEIARETAAVVGRAKPT
jgi:hypothetical protein